MITQPEEASKTDKLDKAIAERDTARRIAAEAMCIMTDEQLVKLRKRLDELEKGTPR